MLNTDDFGVWSLDFATGRVALCAGAADLLGQDPASAQQMDRTDWMALIHPDDRDAFARLLEAVSCKARVRFTLVHRLARRDGRYIRVQMLAHVAARNPDGGPKTLSGTLRDVTDQKSIEAELSLRGAAIWAAQDGIIITDPDGIIRDANPAAATMLGLDDPGGLIGRRWQDGFTPDSVTRLTRYLKTCVAQTGTCLETAVALGAAGDKIEQDLSLTMMPDGHVVWISRDVSSRNALSRERLALGEAIHRAQRQEIVNLLAAGLTHDLSNLTALIANLSDPAMRGFAPKGTEVMEEIHAAARQMVSLLEPIAHLGRRAPVRRAIDLCGLVSEAAGILNLGAPADLKVQTALPPTPVMAELDEMEVMQVLLNLGLNARDALADGPKEIALSLQLADTLPTGAQLQAGHVPDGPFALITISDNGTGIPPELRDQIWEPLFTTKQLSGTGLGLFVVAEIMRSVGGGIALTSELGIGTSFYIAWPISHGTSKDAPV